MDFMSDNDTLSTHSTMSATTSSGLNSVGSALRTYVKLLSKDSFFYFRIIFYFILVVYIKQKIDLVEHFHLVQYHQKIV